MHIAVLPITPEFAEFIRYNVRNPQLRESGILLRKNKENILIRNFPCGKGKMSFKRKFSHFMFDYFSPSFETALKRLPYYR
jgi:hypothetical protein